MSRTATARKTKPATVPVAFAFPEINKGETYAGLLLADGKPAHHLVLLPGETTANWKDAIAWAKKQGGELPTRKEQALLFANAAEAFEQRWYWSSEVHTGYADYAWIQYFGTGYQGNDLKDHDYRARAVRRVAL